MVSADAPDSLAGMRKRWLYAVKLFRPGPQKKSPTLWHDASWLPGPTMYGLWDVMGST